MGAYSDNNLGEGHFIFDRNKCHQHHNGYETIGIKGPGLPSRSHRLDDQIRSWSVCPHLSDPSNLFGYYAGLGSIMLLLGKCLCHDCYESILAKKDLTEFMVSCDHLTDRGFQQDFVQPLFRVNKESFRSRNNLSGNETTCWTWIGCPHVSRPDDLHQLYAGCNPIFFHEGFITCNDCLNVVPSASMYLQILLGCEAMTDAELQERVFKHLYSISRNIVTAVRIYSRNSSLAGASPCS